MTAVVMKLAMALSGMTQNPQATSLMSLPERAASGTHRPTHGATNSAGGSSTARNHGLLQHLGLQSLLAPGSAIPSGVGTAMPWHEHGDGSRESSPGANAFSRTLLLPRAAVPSSR